MINNANRIGNITSSKCSDLKGTPAKRKTYLSEIRMERRLKRSLSTESDAKPLKWGKLLEKFVFQRIGLEYKLTSTETIKHPEIEGWAGSPDGVKKGCVIEIKCPYTLKAYMNLLDICEKKDTDFFKKENPEYYWQIVSNAILLGVNRGELIVYCPYLEDLSVIRFEAQNVTPQDLYKYYWLGSALDDELPYLLKESELPDLVKFEFEIPQSDIEDLTNEIKQAISEL